MLNSNDIREIIDKRDELIKKITIEEWIDKVILNVPYLEMFILSNIMFELYKKHSFPKNEERSDTLNNTAKVRFEFVLNEKTREVKNMLIQEGLVVITIHKNNEGDFFVLSEKGRESRDLGGFSAYLNHYRFKRKHEKYALKLTTFQFFSFWPITVITLVSVVYNLYLLLQKVPSLEEQLFELNKQIENIKSNEPIKSNSNGISFYEYFQNQPKQTNLKLS